ncbi:MAG: hypothetical protein ABIV36_13785 [Sphingobium limneticum]
MDNVYPYTVLQEYSDTARHIGVIDAAADDISAIFKAIISEAESNANSTIIIALARAGAAHVEQLEDASTDVSEYCHAAGVAHEAYLDATGALAKMQETDEGQALRDLSRDLAVMIENLARPAFRAITEMQNGVGEIDAMVRSARDLAGCLRWERSADRAPDLPEAGSLSETVGDAMNERTVAFAAAIARAKARRLGKSLDAA